MLFIFIFFSNKYSFLAILLELENLLLHL